MLKRLAEPALYAAALEHVVAKQRRHDTPMLAQPGGPSLDRLLLDSDALSRRLAKLVTSRSYQLAPLERRMARIEGRERALYRAAPLDLVVMTAVARVLGEALEPGLSRRLFSYRRGYSTLGALREASSYLRQHVRSRSDPRTRAVYVVRRDVRAYGDSIPSHDGAPVWSLLADALRSCGAGLDDAWLDWLRTMIRPAVLAVDGTAQPPRQGIPTGSPLQPIVGNLYLAELDRALEARPAAFYARFGDDLLFMHPDAGSAIDAAQTIDNTLQHLGLSLSTSKCASLYLTVPGRASPVQPFLGQGSFDYLGRRLDARGAIGLSQGKARRLLANVDRRLRNVSLLAGELPADERARLSCSAVNAAIRPGDCTAEPAASSLASELTDHCQLRQLDYLLAQRVARAVTGQRGVRAFRKLPARKQRSEHGLVSLVRQRIEHDRPGPR